MAIRAARRRSTCSDSGVDVVVGLRDGSPSATRGRARRDCASRRSSEAAARRRRRHAARARRDAGALYREIEPHLRQGAALGFSHGLAIRFGLIVPRADLDVFLVAPKGPGTALRSLYQRGQGHDRAVRGRAGRQRRGRGARAGLRPRDRLRPGRADRRPASPRNARPTCSTSRRWCGARSPRSSSPASRRWSRPGSAPEVAYYRMRRRTEADRRSDRGARHRRRCARRSATPPSSARCSAGRGSSTIACAHECATSSPKIRSGAFADDAARRRRRRLSALRAARARARGLAGRASRRGDRSARSSLADQVGGLGLAVADRGALDIGALQLAVRRRGLGIARRQSPARPPRRRGARNSSCPGRSWHCSPCDRSAL